MNNSIIQVDGKFYKKGYPVLLPSENGIIAKSSNGTLYYPSLGFSSTVLPHHLYILSDEEIGIGDWYYEEGEVKQYK